MRLNQRLPYKVKPKRTVYKVLQVPTSVNDLLRVRRLYHKAFERVLVCVQSISNIRPRFGKKRESVWDYYCKIHVQGFSAAT